MNIYSNYVLSNLTLKYNPHAQRISLTVTGFRRRSVTVTVEFG